MYDVSTFQAIHSVNSQLGLNFIFKNLTSCYTNFLFLDPRLTKNPIKNPRKISNNKYYADTSWFYYLYFLDDIYANSLKQDRKHALNCLTEQNRTQTLLFSSKSILGVDFLCTLIVLFSPCPT